MSDYILPIVSSLILFAVSLTPFIIIDCNNDIGANTTPQAFLQAHGITIDQVKAKCNDMFDVYAKFMPVIPIANFIFIFRLLNGYWFWSYKTPADGYDSSHVGDEFEK